MTSGYKLIGSLNLVRSCGARLLKDLPISDGKVPAHRVEVGVIDIYMSYGCIPLGYPDERAYLYGGRSAIPVW